MFEILHNCKNKVCAFDYSHMKSYIYFKLKKSQFGPSPHRVLVFMYYSILFDYNSLALYYKHKTAKFQFSRTIQIEFQPRDHRRAT